MLLVQVVVYDQSDRERSIKQMTRRLITSVPTLFSLRSKVSHTTNAPPVDCVLLLCMRDMQYVFDSCNTARRITGSSIKMTARVSLKVWEYFTLQVPFMTLEYREIYCMTRDDTIARKCFSLDR